MDLKQFEHSFPGVKLLSVSLEDLVPGAVLNQNMTRVGHIAELLGKKEADFPLKTVTAQFAQISDTAKHSGSGGLNILGLVKLDASGNHELSANFTISEAQAEELDGISTLALRAQLQALKSDKAKWNTLNHKFVVTETFLAKRVEVEVHDAKSAGADLDLKKVTSVDVSANLKFDWSSGTELVITGEGKAPFAVRGFIPHP